MGVAEVVRFETNIPQVITLKYDDGKDVAGRYGDEVFYTLADGKGVYVPPIVRDKLTQAGVRRGTPVQITKKEVKTGNRRSIQWEVERVGAGAQPSKVEAPAPVHQQTIQPPAERQAQATTHDTIGGPALVQLKQALAAAITAAQGAENYAKERNYGVRFTSEDVRAMALTLYIQFAKGGR